MPRQSRDDKAMRRLFLPFVALAATTAPLGAAVVESDKAQAREIRSLEKKIAKLEKRYDKLLKRCQGDERNFPDARACDTARVTYQDVQQLKKRMATLAEG